MDKVGFERIVDTLIDRVDATHSDCGDVSENEMNNAKAEILAEFDRLSAIEQARWIPVGERLPEEGQVVIIYVDDNEPYIGLGFWGGNDADDWRNTGNFYMGFLITHWRPLPEPPEVTQ